MNTHENDSKLLEDLAPKVSLQDAFAKFRSKRVANHKYAHYKKKVEEVAKTTNSHKDNLRAKFIETAKKYIGVPYAKRHLKPGDANYDSPLFLDCCGLIRQVIFDLREDFGFTLQRWNQAYQFDTLPIDLKFEELKPGDLIFHSGKSLNPKKKRQIHDMTHVEIFLGGETGEQTIGARWIKGVVKIFDSYKFPSKAYEWRKFHFKSIDTWLDGTCKSSCLDHPWRDDRNCWTSEKYSVFNDEQPEEAADGLDEGTEKCDEETKMSGIENIKPLSEELNLAEITNTFDLNDSKTCLSENNSKNPDKIAVIGKNCYQKIIEKVLKETGNWKVLNNTTDFSKFHFKWVKSCLEIDYNSLKNDLSQLVNHISNISLLTNKRNLVQLLRDSGKSALMCYLPLTYRMDVLSDCVSFIKTENDGVWIIKPENRSKGGEVHLITDVEAFKEQFVKSKKICLGTYGAQQIPGRLQKIKKSLESLPSKESSDLLNINCIIQKYQQDALLIENKRFTFKFFVLIASVDPLVLYYQPAYIVRCIEDYDSGENIATKYQSLASIRLQKSHPSFKEQKENLIWTVERFVEYNKNDEAWKTLEKNMAKIIEEVIAAVAPRLDKKKGCFELLVFNFVVKPDLTPLLTGIKSIINEKVYTDIQQLASEKFISEALLRVTKQQESSSLTEGTKLEKI